MRCRAKHVMSTSKKGRMVSVTDLDDSASDKPSDPTNLFDRHFRKCSQNHILEWLKDVTQVAALQIVPKMSKRALDSDNESDNEDAQSQSQSQSSSKTSAKKRAKMDDANETATIEAFNKRLKVSSRSMKRFLVSEPFANMRASLTITSPHSQASGAVVVEVLRALSPAGDRRGRGSCQV